MAAVISLRQRKGFLWSGTLPLTTWRLNWE